MSRGHVPLQLLVLGLVYNVTGLAVDSSVAFLISFLGKWLKDRLRAAKFLRWLTGGIFIGHGYAFIIPPDHEDFETLENLT